MSSSEWQGAPARQLDELEAYDAMCLFLEAYWERGGKTSNDLAVLLCSAVRDADRPPLDIAQWRDWRAAVTQVRDRRQH